MGAYRIKGVKDFKVVKVIKVVKDVKVFKVLKVFRSPPRWRLSQSNAVARERAPPDAVATSCDPPAPTSFDIMRPSGTRA